jgi:Tfp pilus assembly protein PilX
MVVSCQEQRILEEDSEGSRGPQLAVELMMMMMMMILTITTCHYTHIKYLVTTLTDQNFIHEEIKSRLNSGNACYH